MLQPGIAWRGCVRRGGFRSAAAVASGAAREAGRVLSVVHFNHKLRGKASDADESVSQNCGEAWAGVSLCFVYVEVKQKRSGPILRTRRGGRGTDYSVRGRIGRCGQIAVAHTATIRRRRGGAAFFAGRASQGSAEFIRSPVQLSAPVSIRRGELVVSAGGKQTWREDATNRDIKGDARAIRRNSCPCSEQFQAGIVDTWRRLAELAREDEAFLDAMREARARGGSRNDGRTWIAVEELIQ